jgi:hypothetical protein
MSLTLEEIRQDSLALSVAQALALETCLGDFIAKFLARGVVK